MNAAIVAVQELLAFPHDGDIGIGAKHLAPFKELVSPQGNNDWSFVAVFLNIMERHGPLLPFGYGYGHHESTQDNMPTIPSRLSANQKPNSSLMPVLSPEPSSSHSRIDSR